MFPFYVILAAFCKKSKVIFSEFSITKNYVASSDLSILPIKLICHSISGFSNIYLLAIYFNQPIIEITNHIITSCIKSKKNHN